MEDAHGDDLEDVHADDVEVVHADDLAGGRSAGHCPVDGVGGSSRTLT